QSCAELTPPPDVGAMQGVPHHQLQDVKAIFDTALEVNGRGLGKIACRHRDLADSEAEADRLRHDLLVEDEVVRVEQKRQCLEQAAAVRSKAGVVLGQAQAESGVLDRGQKAVRDEFPPGHATQESR